MSKKLKIGVAIALVVALLCVAVWIVMKNVAVENPTAEVILNGEVIKTIPLSQDCEFTVKSDVGYNVVTVKNGAVSVTEADCPDKVCVRTGAISGGAVPIVCLPNKLEIRIISGSAEIDAQL